MSIFETAEAPCPVCATPVRFDLVASVNADRSPQLRTAILDGSFQFQSCPSCSCRFRPPPRLTYLDVGRGQWILAIPATRLDAWSELETYCREAFDLAYGPEASAPARAIGRALSARIVMGWAALREKLLCRDLGLDDITLELVKLAVIGGVPGAPLADDTELRLERLTEAGYELVWIRSASEARLASLEIPRSLEADIDVSAADWAPLRATLAASPFVDYTRLLLPGG